MIFCEHTHLTEKAVRIIDLKFFLKNIILPLAGGGSTFLGMGTGTISSGTVFLGGSETSKINAPFLRNCDNKTYVVARLTIKIKSRHCHLIPNECRKIMCEKQG